MGFMDKVKSQAAQLAEKAQEATKAGQARLDALQAKRKADQLLAELGLLAYEQHEGRARPGAEEETASVIEQLRRHEAAHGPLTPADLSAADDEEGASAAPAAGGGGTGGAATGAPTPTGTPGGIPTGQTGEGAL
jgi:hypothetical protein